MGEANGNDPAIWTGNNQSIMRCTNSYSGDLVYLDLPFNSIANYAAPIGSASASAESKNIWVLSDTERTDPMKHSSHGRKPPTAFLGVVLVEDVVTS